MYCGIVDPFVSSDYLSQTLKDQGILPIALLSDPSQAISMAPKNFQAKNFIHTLSIADLNEDQIKKRLNTFKPYVIIAGSEFSGALTDRLATILSPEFANSPRHSAWRINKMAMQEAIGRLDIPNITSHVITPITNRQQLNQLLQHWQWPIIIKPTEAAGSFGIKICYTISEIEQQLHKLRNVKYIFAHRPVQTILLQEFLEGEEYFFDTCSYQGQHRLVSLGYYKKVFRSGLPVYRYIELKDFDNEKGRILSIYLKKVLNAVELNNGLSHTEIMLTAKGPRLIEVNPRVSGVYGLVNILARQVYHCDQVSLLAKAINQPHDFLTNVDTIPHFHQPARLVFLHCFENRKLRSLNLSLINQLDSYAGHLSLKKTDTLVSGQSTLADTVMLIKLIHTDPAVIAADTDQLFYYEANNELF